jgi:hypothetical protein
LVIDVPGLGIVLVVRAKQPRNNDGPRRVYECIGDRDWFVRNVRETGRFLEA